MLYKLKEIYICDTYKIMFKEPYYDDYYDQYLQNVYYIFSGLKFIIKKDGKCIDIIDNKEIPNFSFDLEQQDTFLGKSIPIHLAEYFNLKNKNIKLSKKQLKNISLNIIPNLEKELRFLSDNAYVYVGPLELGNQTLIAYYNDHNGEDYYDECKEYRKKLIYSGFKRTEEIEETYDDKYLM